MDTPNTPEDAKSQAERHLSNNDIAKLTQLFNDVKGNKALTRAVKKAITEEAVCHTDNENTERFEDLMRELKDHPELLQAVKPNCDILLISDLHARRRSISLFFNRKNQDIIL